MISLSDYLKELEKKKKIESWALQEKPLRALFKQLNRGQQSIKYFNEADAIKSIKERLK